MKTRGPQIGRRAKALGRKIAPAGNPPGFGNVWAIVERSNYLPSSRFAEDMIAVPGTDDAILWKDTQSSTPLKRITSEGGGTPVWDHVVGTVYTPGKGVLAIEGNHVFVGWRGSTSNGIDKITIDTPSQVWRAAVDTATSVPKIDLDGAGLMYSAANTGTDGLEVYDYNAVSAPTPTRYTANESSSVQTAVLSFDKLWWYIMSSAEELGIREIANKPAPGAWNADLIVDLSAVLGWAGTLDGRMRACPVSNPQVWLSTQTEAVIGKFDETGALILSIDVETDMPELVSGTVMDADTDAFGNYYAICDGTGGTVLAKYTYDGQLITTSTLQGLDVDPEDNSQSIVVTPLTGTIYISHSDGDTTEIRQSF